MKKIYCSFFEKNQVNINPDGQVHPCCFFANTLFVSKSFGYPKKGEIDLRDRDPNSIQNGLQNAEAIAENVPIGYDVYQSYIAQESDFNLENHTMEEILNHPWYKNLEKLREKYETAPGVCQNWCSYESEE